MTQGSDEWKYKVLIESMNAWLDEQRDNPPIETIQTRLVDPSLIQYPCDTVAK
jgi:hypothetical protein